ncbi:hypothetical protein ACLOJK_015643 [Asimina triloba]
MKKSTKRDEVHLTGLKSERIPENFPRLSLQAEMSGGVSSLDCNPGTNLKTKKKILEFGKNPIPFLRIWSENEFYVGADLDKKWGEEAGFFSRAEEIPPAAAEFLSPSLGLFLRKREISRSTDYLFRQISPRTPQPLPVFQNDPELFRHMT